MPENLNPVIELYQNKGTIAIINIPTTVLKGMDMKNHKTFLKLYLKEGMRELIERESRKTVYRVQGKSQIVILLS